jgi:chorismate dehydratase
MTLRVGCVPYLNAKPVVDWFHSPSCDTDAEVIYAVPSDLAGMLRQGLLDVALVSTVELFQAPGLRVLPDISISADGPVRSVRLFSRVPFGKIRSVALDSGSLTSVALAKILLAEEFGLSPQVERHEPDLESMLARADAALIIGRLDEFEPCPPYVLDLGEAWKRLTGLPFCYAAWLTREDVPTDPMLDVLDRAKEWGKLHRGELVRHWSQKLALPTARVGEYLCQVINYDLGPAERKAIELFQEKCAALGLIQKPIPIVYAQK